MKRDTDWRVKDGFIPTRTFEVDELVRYGNHDNTQILEVLTDGLYKVRCFGVKEVYGKPTEYSEEQTVNWYALKKLNSQKETHFKKQKTFRMVQSNRDLSGLIGMVLGDYAGVDFTPEYQRDYVWSDEDKVKLIDSIFNNITIGLFVLGKRDYQDDGKHYEVIDGKQRLTALVDFFEDRFAYKGVYFSELSNQDACHFEDYGIVVGILERPTEEEKYAAFIAVNTFGKVMDEEHLKTVKEKYETL